MDTFWSSIDSLATAIGRNRAVNVNADTLRENARVIAQDWFRTHRPVCVANGADEVQLGELDRLLQELLRLANGRNQKKSYAKVLRAIRQMRPALQARIATHEGQAAARGPVRQFTDLESGIVQTLEQMLLDAALSYRQVLSDVSAPNRYSYRGTATELREVVREVLDHLAPDAAVMKAPGFKLEKNRLAPTMKQKARFILKARGLGDSARSAPEQSVELLEDQIASLARSVYERGSASTHGATVKTQLLSFKAYADAVLAELLQLHAG